MVKIIYDDYECHCRNMTGSYKISNKKGTIIKLGYPAVLSCGIHRNLTNMTSDMQRLLRFMDTFGEMKFGPHVSRPRCHVIRASNLIEIKYIIDKKIFHVMYYMKNLFFRFYNNHTHIMVRDNC